MFLFWNSRPEQTIRLQLLIIFMLCGLIRGSTSSSGSESTYGNRENFNSSTNKISFLRDCSKNNVSRNVTSFARNYANSSSIPTSQIMFSFVAELSPLESDESSNTTDESALSYLHQMSLDTAAEAAVACKTTSSLMTKDGEDNRATVILSIESVVSSISSGELISSLPYCQASSTSSSLSSKCYFVNATLSISISDKSEEYWVMYDALMAIKLSMEDDLFLLPSQPRVRNVRFLGPDPSRISTSYATTQSKSVHVAVLLTMISCMALLAFIISALYKRRDTVFRLKIRDAASGNDKPVLFKRITHDKGDTSPDDNNRRRSNGDRRVTFSKKKEERIIYITEEKTCDNLDLEQSDNNAPSEWDLMDLSDSFKLYLT